MYPFITSHSEGLTPRQVADLMGVKPATVYAWLSRKELKGMKVGHKRFISTRQLKEFMEQREVGEYTDCTYYP
jgi:excisionase family DNA binding protein